ncbi:oligosaccharide biosynthesis protein Alg14 [Motilibacter peucedani]|uniref:Oligosaccharide biosynthesis protein Alg14 n=1 Tax=Motilibacter peucedani TaxID=598650 RepID=A0A420XLM7_9ACTN|nr:hypothetical protein [Motilibacter peucedani]RKS71323.1 oligosaccharide biosynthesis protein Alg14 [Motilibacter peucedani]
MTQMMFRPETDTRPQVVSTITIPEQADAAHHVDVTVSEPEQPADHAGEHLLLVASSGGHLAQLLALRSWWQEFPRTWVTFDTEDARSQLAGEDIVFAKHPTTRNVKNLLRNSVIAAKLMRDVRPTMIVSTGAAVAFPFFLYAKGMHVPTVYLEVFDRVDSRTLTGRLCRPLASEFLVQWEQQRALYKGSRVIGTLL